MDRKKFDVEKITEWIKAEIIKFGGIWAYEQIKVHVNIASRLIEGVDKAAAEVVVNIGGDYRGNFDISKFMEKIKKGFRAIVKRGLWEPEMVLDITVYQALFLNPAEHLEKEKRRTKGMRDILRDNEKEAGEELNDHEAGKTEAAETDGTAETGEEAGQTEEGPIGGGTQDSPRQKTMVDKGEQDDALPGAVAGPDGD